MTWSPFGEQAARTLLVLASAARTPAQGTAGWTFATSYLDSIALDLTVSALTGGTTPSVTFQISRLAADGVYYPLLPPAGSSPAGFSPVTFSAAGAASFDIGPFGTDADNSPASSSYLGSAHNVFTAQMKLTFSVTGAPTSVTFSASLMGLAHRGRG